MPDHACVLGSKTTTLRTSPATASVTAADKGTVRCSRHDHAHLGCDTVRMADVVRGETDFDVQLLHCARRRHRATRPRGTAAVTGALLQVRCTPCLRNAPLPVWQPLDRYSSAVWQPCHANCSPQGNVYATAKQAVCVFVQPTPCHAGMGLARQGNTPLFARMHLYTQSTLDPLMFIHDTAYVVLAPNLHSAITRACRVLTYSPSERDAHRSGAICKWHWCGGHVCLLWRGDGKDGTALVK